MAKSLRAQRRRAQALVLVGVEAPSTTLVVPMVDARSFRSLSPVPFHVSCLPHRTRVAERTKHHFSIVQMWYVGRSLALGVMTWCSRLAVAQQG